MKAANPDLKLNQFGEIYNLNPVQIINTPDKTILIKEIQRIGTEQNSNVYFRMGAIISIYSKDLKLIKDIPINKFSSNFIMSFDQICGHVKDDKLYAVTNERNGFGFSCVLYKVNMNDFSMTTKDIPNPESGINWITRPSGVIWSDTDFRIPFSFAKASLKLKLKTEWAVENY